VSASRRTAFVVAVFLVAFGGCRACEKKGEAPSGPAASSSASSASGAKGDPLAGVAWSDAPLDWTRALPVQPAGGTSEDGYVGSAACTACHAGIAKAYARHSMARTGLRPLAALDAKWLQRIFDEGAKAPVQHAGSGFSYRPLRDGDRYFVEELIDGDDGKRVHTWVQPITHAYSAGAYGMAFYAQQGEHFLHVPVDYYAQLGRWGLDPVASKGNPRFSTKLEAFCISCHGDYPRMRAGTIDAFVDPLPTGVGCERCHGPGKKHVATSKPEDIVVSTKLSPARQMDACAQCHESSASTLRADRGEFSYRPGEPLDAYRVNFVEQPAQPDRFQLLAHPERLIQSACFRGSAGKLTCTTCHDPHVSSFDEPKKWWDDKCASCHADPSAKNCTEDPKVRAAEGDHCVACHMRKGPPVRPTMVTVTDHWIQRRPPPVRPGEETPAKIAAWSSFFGEHDEGADLAAVQVVAFDELGMTNDAVAGEIAALAGFPHVPRFYALLAEQCARPGGAPTCAKVDAAVLRFAPDDPDALLGYARAMLDVGSPPAISEAMHALDRMTAIDSDAQLALETRGVFSFRSGDVEAAKTLFARATSYPYAAASHVGLAALALHDGRDGDAIAELEAARLVEPGDPWIGDRLAKLYASSGDATHAQAIAAAIRFFDAHGGRHPTPATLWLPPQWR
jgi:hypothetical protein